MTALVRHAHAHNLTAEWYMNGCNCVGPEHNPNSLQNYQGDVAAIRLHGFDGVKFDGCGRNENLTLYAELLQASVDPSKPHHGEVLIENCHWGLCPGTEMGPTGHTPLSRNYMKGRDNASCPTLDFCPYNTYRISGDIDNSSGALPDPCHKLPHPCHTAGSWVRNLNNTIPYLDPKQPLSRPGCWQTPDNLQVTRVEIPPLAGSPPYVYEQTVFACEFMSPF